jgi:hypothetical protein
MRCDAYARCGFKQTRLREQSTPQAQRVPSRLLPSHHVCFALSTLISVPSPHIIYAMDLGALLLASLQPQSRQNAETQLTALSTQPGFLIHLLQLVLDSNQLIQTRQAGGVYFKNNVKRRWDAVGRHWVVLLTLCHYRIRFDLGHR